MRTFLATLLAGAIIQAVTAGPTAARTWQVPAEAPTIAAAIDSAAFGDIIDLAPGVYHESDLILKPGLAIRAADPASGATIDAGSAGRIFTADLGHNISLVGLTLTGGLTYNGAAARFATCLDLKIRNCTFVANLTTSGIGGALQVSGGSTAVIEDCLFQDNDAPMDDGGAIFLDCPSADVNRCTFIGNHAVNGGGISCRGEDVSITDCIFLENSAFNGAGLDLQNHSAVVTDCLFAGNTATRGGAAGCWYGATPMFTGCTMVQNTASDQGGALYCTGGSVATVERTLIAFNTGGGAVACVNEGSASLVCSDVYGNVGGDWTGCLAGQEDLDGNFSLDPIFCPPSPDPTWELSADSPCLPDNSPCGQLVGALGQGCGAAGVPVASSAPLLQVLGNHPNPFNPSTIIAFHLQQPATVDLRIYDLSGRLVRELAEGEHVAAGRHERSWDGLDAHGRVLAAGTYLYRVSAGGQEAGGAMLLLK